MWVVRVGGDDERLRPYHYIYLYSNERIQISLDWLFRKPRPNTSDHHTKRLTEIEVSRQMDSGQGLQISFLEFKMQHD